MSNKVGRPTNDFKGKRESFRLSDNEVEKLNFCATKGNMTKTEVIRKGIEIIHKELMAQV